MKKILVVDDEDLICYALTAIFRDGQTEVISAPNGYAALKIIDESHLDLCFLDIYLPDINGLEIMKRLRNSSPGTKIIIMTSGEVSGSMMKSIREYAHSLISKSFDLDQVKQFVDQVIAKSQQRYREDCLAIRDYTSFIKWIADDSRKHERKPTHDCIPCFTVASRREGAPVQLTATVLDMSDTGIGILTDCRLQPGALLRLCDTQARSIGVVRWSECDETAKLFRSGIQFITAENPSNWMIGERLSH